MNSQSLNALYSSYLENPHEHQAQLFTAIFKRAARVMRDEDEAQDFVIGVWRDLPIPPRETGSFSAWVGRRLMWHKVDASRRKKSSKETLASDLPLPPFDEDSEPTNDEKLDTYRFRYDNRSARPLDTHDLSSISDPMIRQSAELILLGYTQKEISEMLGVSFEALRKRIQRFSA